MTHSRLLDANKTKDPAFGLDAYWILPAQRDYARMLGYTVVDAATAIATHVNMVLKDNAQELLGHEETHQLRDMSSIFESLAADSQPAGT